VKVERSPLHGEHTDEVLSEVLGYADNEVAGMRQAGAFTREPPKTS
jgi:formyl-CoA transferase